MKLTDLPRVTVILRHVDRRVVDWVFGAIVDQGLDLAVEITRNSSNFGDLPEYIARYPEVRVGAGTVLTADDALAAIDAGCKFVLSPVLLEPQTITLCKQAGLLVVSGAYSPTEILQAHTRGADVVKVFPIRDLGPDYVKDVKAPLGDIPIMAVGGVDTFNMAGYLARGIDYVGIGTGLFGKPLTQLDQESVHLALRNLGARLDSAK